MIHLSPHYKNFLALLSEKQVRYLLVGGYAVQYYGHSRPTSDLDIWIAADPLNARRLTDVFQDFGVERTELLEDSFQDKNRLIRLQIPPLIIEILNPIISQKPENLSRIQGNQTQQIEILTIQSGASFEACFTERVVDYLDGVEVNIISLRRLQAVKGATDRPKDIQDLVNLR